MGKTGVRTFHDYMHHDRMGDYSFEQVLDMEQKLCRQEPFLSLGRYIHVYARKPFTEVTPTVVTNLNDSNKDKG